MMTDDFSSYNPEGSALRRAQWLMLDILSEIDRVCKKHGLQYWLSSGTMIGAVRHKGFIPWDDDLDIEMMREDYLKLLQLLPAELPSSMVLQTSRTAHYGSHISKVRYINSYMNADMAESTNLEHRGVFVDIFPVERMYMFPKRVIDVFYCPSFKNYKLLKPFSSMKNFLKYSLALFLLPFCFLAIGCLRAFYGLWKTNRMAYAYGIDFHRHRRHNEIFPLKIIDFEDRKLPCPNNTDAYLRRLFGDYMQVPPPEKRVTHATEIKIW